jgi:bacteriorhodopsin
MKVISMAVLSIAAAIAADEYYNYGYYTDGALAMLHQIQHSLGL